MPAAAPQADVLGRLVVLLGDPVLRAVTVRRLELLGYAVATASEAGTMNVAVLDAGADAVLIDLELSERAALRAVERLAADEQTERVPVLGFAGDCPLHFVEEAHAAGVADCLVVPFDPLVLERKVAALISRPTPAGGAAHPNRPPTARTAV